MSAQGGPQTRLTISAASEIGTSWQPLPRTFTVNSILDTADLTVGDGTCFAGTIFGFNQCTLRAAIQEANANPGPDVIDFNIPGTGVHTIAIGSSGLGPLPRLNDTATIDGYTQPGASANTLARGTNAVLEVELNAASATDSVLVVQAPNTVILSLIHI